MSEVEVGRSSIKYSDITGEMRRAERGMASAKFRETSLKRMTLESGDVAYLKAMSRELAVSWCPSDPGAKDMAMTLAQIVGSPQVDNDAVVLGSLLLGKPVVFRGAER